MGFLKIAKGTRQCALFEIPNASGMCSIYLPMICIGWKFNFVLTSSVYISGVFTWDVTFLCLFSFLKLPHFLPNESVSICSGLHNTIKMLKLYHPINVYLIRSIHWMVRSKNNLFVDVCSLYVIFPWTFMLCPGDTGTTEHKWRHCKKEAATCKKSHLKFKMRDYFLSLDDGQNCRAELKTRSVMGHFLRIWISKFGRTNLLYNSIGKANDGLQILI